MVPASAREIRNAGQAINVK